MSGLRRLFTRLILIKLVIFGALAAFAQQPHPYFYRVEANGHTSYILGTLPTANIRLEDYDPSLLKAILQSKLGLVQYRHDHLLGAEGLRPFLGGTKPLRDVLSRGAYSRYEKWVDSVAREVPDFKKDLLRFSPGVAMMTVWNRGLLNPMGDKPFEGPYPTLMKQVLAKFTERNIKNEAMEYPESFYTYMGNLVEPQIANQFFMQYLDTRGNPTLKTAKDYNVPEPADEERYFKGTLEGSLVGDGEMSPFVPIFMSLLKPDIWMKNIVERMTTQSTFMAVDVIHVEGPMGLVARLRATEGFRVTKMGCENLLSSRPN